MRIRTRALLVLMIVISTIGTISLLFAWVLATQGLQRRETLEVQATLARAGEGLTLRVDQLEMTSKDWSVWDDTYAYLQGSNPDFVRGNLATSALETIDVDFIVLVDASGKVFKVAAPDPNFSTVLSLPPGVGALMAAIPDVERQGGVGILATSRGPLLASVKPVLRSDGTGPSAGTLVVGRYLDEEDADQLAQLTGAAVSFLDTRTTEATLKSQPAWADPQSRTDGVVVATGRDSVSGYMQIQGLDGNPGLVVAVEQPRTTMILARQTGIYLLVAVGIASMALLVGDVLTIDMVVTRRLERLSENVRAITQGAQFGARVDTSGNDEISELATDINLMLIALQESQYELEYLADHDMLTGLYNRRRFEEELRRDALEQIRAGGRGAVLWLDIDNFKEINDVLGHAVGDRVLEEFSGALKHETRGYATLARIGGDEFALILPNADRDEAEAAASRLIGLLRTREFEIQEHRIIVQVSVGIALYPDQGTTADQLLVCADHAMYQAKNSGGDGFRVYDG